MSKIPAIEQIARFEQEGLVSVRPHRRLPLRIVNYTPKAQYERAWTPELLSCRGLVFDETTSRLVARSLPKFFNYEEHVGDAVAGPLPSGDFTVTEKYDGSLGIVFKYNDELVVATRGSFHSEQADKAMEIIRSQWSDDLIESLDHEHTHLFEIIYPANRIVVDYGDTECLQWLTSIRTQDGYEIEDFGTLFGGIDRLPASSPEELKKQSRNNAEGYVLRYDSGQRVKIKFADYVRLHALVTGLNTVSVWEHLRSGGTMQQLLDPLPDEWMKWARKEAETLTDAHRTMEDAAYAVFSNIESGLGFDYTRKQFAEVAVACGNPQLQFMLLDGNKERLSAAIWKIIKPERRTPITGIEC